MRACSFTTVQNPKLNVLPRIFRVWVSILQKDVDHTKPHIFRPMLQMYVELYPQEMISFIFRVSKFDEIPPAYWPLFFALFGNDTVSILTFSVHFEPFVVVN